MIDEKSGKQIRAWHPGQDLTVDIPDTPHPEQQQFADFAAAFAQWSDAITWTSAKGDADLPGFTLKENIVYSALPLERELTPFLNGLACLGCPDPAPEIRQMLDRIDLPCSLTLYIALQCPHCPGMVEALIPLAAYCPNIHLHIIDGSLFPEKAAEEKVMAAPCLILDRDFRWTGAVSESEIISMILNRDPATLSTATLKNILEAGDADWITDKMISSGQIFDGFVGLLLHQTWSVRLGAMVVVEALAEKAQELSQQLAPRLMAVFEEREIPVQGDILYALGEVGDTDTAAWIRRTVKETDHDDLRDAAEDAVDAIESRHLS